MKHAEAAQLVMSPIIEAVIPHFPPKVWEDMSAQFCTTFWSLTMYDLYVPMCVQSQVAFGIRIVQTWM